MVNEIPMTPRSARILIIVASAALLAALALAAEQTRSLHAPVPVAQVRQFQAGLADLVRLWARQGPAALARDDGYVMTVDVGQLLTYAARAGDHDLYELLHDRCLPQVVVDDPSDPFLRGMVRWRCKDGVTESATGTTEALRVAQGLWLGARAFHRPQDQALALRICRAYARHAAYDDTNHIWLIRNYCSLVDKHFADNSYLVDYGPDFLAAAAASDDADADLRDVAARSLALVEQGRAPCGLMYDLIEPGVRTMLPGTAGIAVCGPNDLVQVSNSATVAEQCVRGDPALARSVLDFALSHAPNLKTRYYGRTGEPAGDLPPGPETYAVLVRLAVDLDDQQALAVFLPPLLDDARRFLASGGSQPRLFEAGEILLALQAVSTYAPHH
jgi:hypothetical protein